ncbi:MAG: LptF/LptG family permease [Planctomycetes bacterium]|nr:LptF/LptG family permease [Planctomycetota bacterium]
MAAPKVTARAPEDAGGDAETRGRIPLPRPRIIDRYVGRAYVFSYLVCAVSFTGLYMIIELFGRLERLTSKDVPLLEAILRYYMANLPIIYTQYLGPVLTLTAAMFAVTMLNKTNELTPLKASGMSLYRILLPIFFFAGGFAVLGFLSQEFLIPNMKDQIRIANSLAQSRDWITPSPFTDAMNNTFRIRYYSPTEASGSNVTIIHREGDPAFETRRIQAAYIQFLQGDREGEGVWEVQDGWEQRYDPKTQEIVYYTDASGERTIRRPFRHLRLETDMRPVDIESSDEDIPYLSFSELKQQLRRHPYHHHLEVKIHYRFAFPLMHLILLFLGIPFVLNQGNRSIFLSVAVSIAICFACFIVSSISVDVGNKGGLPPVVAAWLPTIFFGALGLTLFDNIRT